MKRLGSLMWAFGLLTLFSAARPAHALFHFAVIDEVMTSYGGDPNVQFVEVKMLLSSQQFVTDAVLGAFDASGTYLGDVLILPNNVSNSGADVRFLMATQAFETASGLTPDFSMPAGLPTGDGMVCWGAPGASVPDPNGWDHSDPGRYVDCVAYGNYSGPTPSGTPTPLDGDGHSLLRISNSNDNETDFICGDPANPENNDGATVDLAATTPCPVEPVIPVLPLWGEPLLIGLFLGLGTLLILRRRTGLGLAPPPQ